MKERRSSSEPGSATTNILSVLLKGDSSGHLSDRDLRETILTVLFAAHDASATVLTWAMKFLNDDPTLLDSFTVSATIDRRNYIKTGYGSEFFLLQNRVTEHAFVIVE